MFQTHAIVWIANLPLASIAAWSPKEKIHYGNEYLEGEDKANKEKYTLVKKVAKEFTIAELQALKLINIYNDAIVLSDRSGYQPIEEAAKMLDADENEIYLKVSTFVELQKLNTLTKKRSYDEELATSTYFINSRLDWKLFNKAAFEQEFGITFVTNEWTNLHSELVDKFIPKLDEFYRNERQGIETISESVPVADPLGENSASLEVLPSAAMNTITG
jgi:hypothetical protein